MRRPLLLLGLLGLSSCSSNRALAAGLDEARSAAERTFDWTLGDWHGVRRSADDGREEPLTMRVTPVLGGVGQLRELEVRHSGGVYRGLALQVYEPKEDRWVRQYVNDVHRTYAQLEGRVEGGYWVWRSATSRVVSERIGPDRWRRTVSRSIDGGATWTELFTDELQRR